MKKKLEQKKYIHVSIDTFRVDIAVFVNHTFEEAVTYSKRTKKLHRLAEYLEECDSENILEGANEGIMYPLKQGYAVFLRLEKDNYRKNIGLISHEVSHLVSFILLDRRIPLSKETDEVYAYLTEEIMLKILYGWY